MFSAIKIFVGNYDFLKTIYLTIYLRYLLKLNIFIGRRKPVYEKLTTVSSSISNSRRAIVVVAVASAAAAAAAAAEQQ